MAWRELTRSEVDDLLTSQRIVRVAFAEGAEKYVIPLGFVWVDEALWGTSRHGRKTAIASRDSRVAFTIDDSATAPAFEWRSCVGEGDFEVVSVTEFQQRAGARMREAFPDNPTWNQREWAAGLDSGVSICWRLRPSTLTGRVPQPS